MPEAVGSVLLPIPNPVALKKAPAEVYTISPVVQETYSLYFLANLLITFVSVTFLLATSMPPIATVPEAT